MSVALRSVDHSARPVNPAEATLDYWLVAPDGGILMEWSADPREQFAARDARKAWLESLLGDLFRCPHGRKNGDICSGEKGCGGPSKGGPLQGQVIGYTITGRPITLPEGPMGKAGDPATWVKGDET